MFTEWTLKPQFEKQKDYSEGQASHAVDTGLGCIHTMEVVRLTSNVSSDGIRYTWMK